MQIIIYVINTKNIDINAVFYSSFLSDEDRISLEKYKNEEARKEKTASLYLKRKYVGKYTLNEYGKPISNHLFFNVSHSHGLILLAINDKYPIGVDVELVRKAKQELIDYVTNEEERKTIKSDEDFYNIWTSKESLLKAIGTGINTRINDVPALPLNGKRIYQNKTFVSKTVNYDDYTVTATVESNEEIQISFIKEM